MLPESPGQHRNLRGCTEVRRCTRKSLIGMSFVGFSMRQHARAESMSKRATPLVPSVKAGRGRVVLVEYGRDQCTNRVNRTHHLRLRQRGGIHLKADSVDAAERFAVPQNLFGDLVGTA